MDRFVSLALQSSWAAGVYMGRQVDPVKNRHEFELTFVDIRQGVSRFSGT